MAAELVTAKKYDWKDSNIAMIGSDSDRKVKKESAQTEPAWKGAGEKVGLQIWRIVNFKARAPAFHPYGSQQYPSRAAPKLVYSGAPTLHKEFCQQLVGTRYLGQYANAAIHNRWLGGLKGQ
eukprot:Em0003g1688a